MLNIFKKLFSKSEDKPVPTAPASIEAAAPARPATPAGPVASAGVPAAGADSIKVSVKSVLPLLSDMVRAKMVRDVVPTDMIALPRSEVMAQLSSGSVKISFMDLTRRAPGIFANPDAELAATMLNLPLQEILPQIKQLPRRQAQKVVEIPSDLQQVFGPGSAQKAPVPPPPSVAAPEAPRTSVSTAPVPTMATTRPAATTAPTAPPAARPVPQPPAPPVPKPPAPAPVANPAPSAPAAYVPPEPKPLENREAIKFALPGQTPAAPTPPPPPPTPVAAPLPVRPSAPVPSAPAPTASVADGPVIAFGDIFGQPDKKDWSAQEIVQKAGALRGVAGALITTGDGLPVAFHLPENLSGNLVAAFVPQMFTRIIQYTRDLKLGEARHITLLIENVPLQIFRTGSVYFTVLGKAGENLPKPQLTAISNALGHQNP